MDARTNTLPLVVVAPTGGLRGGNEALLRHLECDARDLWRRTLWDVTDPAALAWAPVLNQHMHAGFGVMPDVDMLYPFRTAGGRDAACRVVVRSWPGSHTVGVLVPGEEPAPHAIERHFSVESCAEPRLVEAPPVPLPMEPRFTMRLIQPGRADAGLTARELEVVALVGQGLRNAEIARRLFVTEGAVKKRLQAIFGKLNLPNRAAVAGWAVRRGMASALAPCTRVAPVR